MESKSLKDLALARILYISLIITVLVYAQLLYITFPQIFDGSAFAISGTTLTFLIIILGALALFGIYAGFRFPMRIIKAPFKTGLTVQKTSAATIVSAASFETVALYGFILGFFGASTLVTAPFLVIAAGLFIISFPTKAKWKRMAREIENNDSYKGTRYNESNNI